MYRQAGIKGVPKTYSKFLTDGKKLMKKFGKNRNFSAFYEPGQNWYAATTFVEDYGAQIAVQEKNGKWKGTIDSPQAVKALTIFKSMVRNVSPARQSDDVPH